MMYLSQLLGAGVEDTQGERAGKIVDVLVDAFAGAEDREAIYRVPTIVVEGEGEQRWYVPADSDAPCRYGVANSS